MNKMGLPKHVQDHKDAPENAKVMILADYLSTVVDTLLPNYLQDQDATFFERLFEGRYAELQSKFPRCSTECPVENLSSAPNPNPNL